MMIITHIDNRKKTIEVLIIIVALTISLINFAILMVIKIITMMLIMIMVT